jgi:hypothetical protein
VERPGEYGYQPSIAVDSSGETYISYYDDATGDLIFASRNGGAWSYEPVDTSGTVGEWSSLTLDSGDNPVVSYCDRTNGELKLAKRSSLVAVGPPAAATGVHLRTPAPNPRRGSGAITLEFATPREQLLGFTLVDATGRQLESRGAARYGAGTHRVTWDIGRRSPGVYFVRMWTGSGQTVNKKLVVVP